MDGVFQLYRRGGRDTILAKNLPILPANLEDAAKRLIAHPRTGPKRRQFPGSRFAQLLYGEEVQIEYINALLPLRAEGIKLQADFGLVQCAEIDHEGYVHVAMTYHQLHHTIVPPPATTPPISTELAMDWAIRGPQIFEYRTKYKKQA